MVTIFTMASAKQQFNEFLKPSFRPHLTGSAGRKCAFLLDTDRQIMFSRNNDLSGLQAPPNPGIHRTCQNYLR